MEGRRQLDTVSADRRQEKDQGAAVALLHQIHDPSLRGLHLVQLPDELLLLGCEREGLGPVNLAEVATALFGTHSP